MCWRECLEIQGYHKLFAWSFWRTLIMEIISNFYKQEIAANYGELISKISLLNLLSCCIKFTTNEMMKSISSCTIMWESLMKKGRLCNSCYYFIVYFLNSLLTIILPFLIWYSLIVGTIFQYIYSPRVEMMKLQM